MELTGSIKERLNQINDPSHVPGIEFWQAQEPEVRIAAVWELVVTAHARKGEDVTNLRLDKLTESFQKIR